MTTVLGRDTSIYWGSAAAAPTLVNETRTVSIDLSPEYVDDTVHGDVNRTESPTYTKFNASVTGLWDTTATTGSDRIVKDANTKVSGKFSIYIGNISRYFTASGYVGVDDVSGPYDDFAGFGFSFRPIGVVSIHQI